MLKTFYHKTHTYEKKVQIISLIIILGLESCVSLNSHNVGRTVGKDNHSIFANFNFGHIDSKTYNFPEDSARFYIAEVGTLHGIEKNLDLGIKINSSFHITGVGKFQYIGDEKSLFASSIGVDIGAGIPQLAMGAEPGNMSYSGSISLFNSVHPTEYLAFTLSPRYTYLGFTGRDTRSNNIYGYSAGIIIGKKHQFSFELSQYVNNTKFTFDTKPIFSLGYIINFK